MNVSSTVPRECHCKQHDECFNNASDIIHNDDENRWTNMTRVENCNCYFKTFNYEQDKLLLEMDW